MTEEQIERMVQAMVPELRIAFSDLFREHAAFHIFDCAVGTNSETGVKTKYVCFIAEQGAAAVIEGTCKGMAEAQRLFQEQMAQLARKAG